MGSVFKLRAILLWSLTAINILVSLPGLELEEENTLALVGSEGQEEGVKIEEIEQPNSFDGDGTNEADNQLEEEEALQVPISTRRTTFKLAIMVAFTMLSLTVGFFLLITWCPFFCRFEEAHRPRKYIDTQLETGNLFSAA